VLEVDESLGGDGCPAVAAFTPDGFAAAVGTSPGAAARLIGDALALRHRLPILWKRVKQLQVPAWQARRVCEQTQRLPAAGAHWVDQQLGLRTGLGPALVERLVAHAVAALDPEAQEAREEDAEAGWDVRVSHPAAADFVGTSHLEATGDTLTLKAFNDLVCAIAHQLHVDGDASHLGARKVKALGVIVALLIRTTSSQSTGAVDVSTVADAARKSAAKVKLYAHLDARDLDVDATGASAFAAGAVERLGAATLAKLRSWVGESQVIIQPVLDMDRRDAVDGHDPPVWMAELVRLRDGHCIFPRCTVDARDCDLDHEVPYVPMDEGGPPGQTHPDGLACLCRRHHRAKTSRRWRYTRTPEGHYVWDGPYGRNYLRTPDGTHTL
jgi:hypothetical protein